MATITGPKHPGPFTFDLSDVQAELVDLAPGAMRGARTEGEGMKGVVEELAEAMPAHGADLDVPGSAYQRVVDRTALLAKLRDHEAKLAKALEVVRETRAKTENDREDDISIIAKAVQGAAARKKDPSVAAPFEKTLAYNSRIADKSAETRRKNADEPDEGEGGNGGGGNPT
jgi:hypothetical protein